MTDPAEFNDALVESLERLGVQSRPAQGDLLWGHYQLLLEANRKFNLTRITDPRPAAIRLYADSAAALSWSLARGSAIVDVLDVGSGAGFPAVPLAVLAPKWNVTALEATGKKARFIEQTARQLGIANLRAVHAHSDHWPAGPTFDLITFKAVDSLEACLTTGERYARPGGVVAAYKTRSIGSDQTRAGRQVAQRLGFDVLPPFEYGLADAGETVRFTLHLFARRM